MKICVIGAGFTGLMAALSLKRHCPQHHVIMIDSPTLGKNVYFGESGPPQALQWLYRALKIPPKDQSSFLVKWLTETKSTVKYNFKWQNFLDKHDSGWFSGLPDLPSADIIFDPHHTTYFTNPRVTRPNHKEYKLYDIWYELYLKGQRTIDDWGPDLNSYYWYCKHHVMDSINNGFLNGYGSVHINSVETGKWLLREFGHEIDQIIVDSVREVVATEKGGIKNLVLESSETVRADFYLDCTGFKRLLGNRFKHEWKDPSTKVFHDRALITNTGYTENIDRELHPYTIGYGMDYGWTFSIPLLDRAAWGYVYHSDFIDQDQALAELQYLSPDWQQVVDPFEISWHPGNYQLSWQQNYAMVGLSAGFIDPFDANLITLQFRQIFHLISCFNRLRDIEPDLMEYNRFTNLLFEKVAQRLQYHQCLAPKNTSEYWKRNHDVAAQLNLKEQALDELNTYEHSAAAEDAGDFIPYVAHLYLTETLYFGLDMSKRCRKSDPQVLQLADEYFKSQRRLNQLRAEIAPSMRQWYNKFGINFDDSITFRK